MDFKSKNNLLIFFILISACNAKNQNSVKIQDSTKYINNRKISKGNEDSIQLTKLIRTIYQWHETDTSHLYMFSPQKNNASDTLYTRIDLDANNEVIKKLKATGFFAKDFLDNYRKIAVRMDKELRDGTSLWPVGELSTFGDDADEWCNCQDTPVDDYWKTLKLTDIKISNDEARFNWTWGDNFYYKVKAKIEDNQWRISYLQGFDMNNYSWEWWKKNKNK